MIFFPISNGVFHYVFHYYFLKGLEPFSHLSTRGSEHSVTVDLGSSLRLTSYWPGGSWSRLFSFSEPSSFHCQTERINLRGGYDDSKYVKCLALVIHKLPSSHLLRWPLPGVQSLTIENQDHFLLP